MHIILSTSELKKLDISFLPEGTTLAEQEEGSIGYLRSYVVSKGKLVLARDFIEEDREWNPGEKDEFIIGKTKEDVFDYFLCHDDEGPHREWRAMGELEMQYFSFIKHAGSYIWANDEVRYNFFEVMINQDSDLDAAEGEVKWMLDRIADYHSNINPIEIKIFEHTLSEFGTYSVLWNRKKTFEICKTTYGSPNIINKFTSLRGLIEHISRHHYYE